MESRNTPPDLQKITNADLGQTESIINDFCLIAFNSQNNAVIIACPQDALIIPYQ